MKIEIDIPDGELLALVQDQAKAMDQSVEAYCLSALLYQTICWRGSADAPLPRETHVASTGLVITLDRAINPILSPVAPRGEQLARMLGTDWKDLPAACDSTYEEAADLLQRPEQGLRAAGNLIFAAMLRHAMDNRGSLIWTVGRVAPMWPGDKWQLECEVNVPRVARS